MSDEEYCPCGGPPCQTPAGHGCGRQRIAEKQEPHSDDEPAFPGDWIDGQNDGLMDAFNALHALFRERDEARAERDALKEAGVIKAASLLICEKSEAVLAILRGEAVAVPREPTEAMLDAVTPQAHEWIGHATPPGSIERWQAASRLAARKTWAVMLAASPYAEKRDE